MLSNKRKFDLAGVLMFVAAVLMFWQHQKRIVILRDESSELLDRLAQLETQAADCKRLGQQASEAEAAPRAASEQLAELARLRRETAERGAEIAKLRGPNGAQTMDRAGGIPQSAWHFAGFDTPESTLESLAWAIHRGDLNVAMSGFSPEAAREIQKEWEGMSEEQIRNAYTAGKDGAAEPALMILNTTNISPDEVRVTAYMTTDPEPSAIRLKRIDGVWKVSGLSDDNRR